MDQNESPWDVPETLKSSLLKKFSQCEWCRYPQPQTYKSAKRVFAAALGFEPEQLAITSGCDGAIQGIHALSGGPGRRALTFLPTYPMLSHAARLTGTEMHHELIGPDYKILPERAAGFDLILLANPNNPTGNLTDLESIRVLLHSGAMVFIDEAYFDLSGHSVASLLGKYPNLSIGRSCSKSFLAGLRLGALIGSPLMIQAYESLVTAPYHLGSLQLLAAGMYHEIQPLIHSMSDRIASERNWMVTRLTALGLQVYPSVTNFILFKIREPVEVYRNLLQRGIRIRDMSGIKGLESHLRVTIGTPEENRMFIDALSCVMKESGEE
jgi:histidinol-phosphate aminotransferase